MEMLLKTESKIHGARITASGYRLKSDRGIYKRTKDMENIATKIKKVLDTIVGINLGRLKKQIFDKLYNLKIQEGYMKQMKEELERFGILILEKTEMLSETK